MENQKAVFMFFSSIKATLSNHPQPHSALIVPLLLYKSVTVARQQLKY